MEENDLNNTKERDKLYYKIIGDINNGKPNILFIHGAGGSSVMWYKNLRALRKEYNLILIDLRGHGKSYNTDFNKDDDFDTLAEDLKYLITELNIDKYIVISLSLGTIVNMALANIDDRIQCSILIGATIELNIITFSLLWILGKVKYIVPYKLLYKICALILMPKVSHKESRKVFVKEFGTVKRKNFLNYLNLGGQAVNILKKLRSNFKTKSLFISGEDDYLFKNQVKKFVNLSPLFEYIEIQNCGHVANIDNTIETNNVILNYLKHNI